jgi:DNA-binding IclR family transcriptional regulator
LKQEPAYAITSVDHALRLAAMLQMEGAITVTEAAERLGVARSTAHRILTMLVYRDFAAQHEDRSYRAGPVLELSAHSHSSVARMRALALPHLHELVRRHQESANLTVRAGATARFIATVECQQTLRVGSREGMVFPAHRTTGGLLLLADLDHAAIEELYRGVSEQGTDRPELDRLRSELARIRRNGFVVNQGRSERGVTAIGVAVRESDGRAVAGLSLSMPSVRYEKARLPYMAESLQREARAIERALIA